ncbi:MAG: hypothetical protein WBE70_08295, partial [Candidatus Acidiferrum sp.]
FGRLQSGAGFLLLILTRFIRFRSYLGKHFLQFPYILALLAEYAARRFATRWSSSTLFSR